MNISFLKPTIKIAMPVLTEEPNKKELRDEGMYQVPDAYDVPHNVSIVNELKKKGVEFDLSLPKIYKYKPNFVRTINGKPYLIFEIEESKNYKRVPADKKNLVTPQPDGTFLYPGKIRAISVDTGDVEVFNYLEVYENIKNQSVKLSEETRKKINIAINKYNKRIAKIDTASANLTVLPLQLNSVKTMIDKRIKTLDKIISATQNALKKEKPTSVTNYEKNIDQKIQSGNLGEREFQEYVLTKYVYHYDQLLKDLEDGTLKIPATIPNPEEYKQKLMTIGQVAFDKYMADRAKRKEEKPSEKPPFDITKQKIQDIRELLEGEVPFSVKTDSFLSYEGMMKSLYATIENSTKDKTELSNLSNAFAEVAQTIGKLPPESRGMEQLKTPVGQEIVQKIKDLCNSGLKTFTERYSNDIVDDKGNLDSSKFGRRGSMGNALLIVAFTRIYAVLAELFRKAELPPPLDSPILTPAEKTVVTPSGPSTGTQEQVQASNKKIIKIAKSDWENLK